MQINFRNTLIAYTLIIVVFAAAGTSLYTIGSSRERAVLTFDNSCKSSLRLAAAVLADSVYKGDAKVLRPQLERLAREGGLMAIGVYQANGKPLVHVQKGSAFNADFPELRAYGRNPGELRSLYEHDQLRVAGPIHSDKGRFLGFLVCDFSMQQVYAGQRQLTLSTIGLTTLAIALSAIFAVAFSWKVTGPIRRMIQVTEQISQQRFDARVRPTRQQELNSLAQTINAMAEHLQHTTVSKDYVSSIVDSMWDGLLVVDDQGCVCRTNPAACRLFGKTEDDLAGDSISRLLSTLDGAPYDPMDLLIDQLPEGVDGFAENDKGERTPVSISAAPVEEHRGERQQFVVVLKDITVRKETEAALDLAIRDAQHACQVKGEFLANMSHELRTPMNSIIGFTKRLIGKLEGEISDRHMDALSTVDRNAKHLLGLINDILDISKIEAGRMELKRNRFNFRQVAQDVVEQTASLRDGKPLQVKLHSPQEVEIEADRVKTMQIVTNLVSNAIKYSDMGQVDITIREFQDADGQNVAELEVKDTGIGIEDDDLKRLFKKFTQLDSSSTRAVGGTGLGLYITMQYVEMHGGRMRVESTFGKGSTFTVTLPIHADASLPDYRADCATRSSKAVAEGNVGALILCVDDDDDSRKLLKLTLEEESGYQVISADGFESAIALASAHKPDLICLDINMPGRSGFEVKEALANDPLTSDIPIIFVSSEDDLAKQYGLNEKEVFIKPIDTVELLAAVRDAITAGIDSILLIEDEPAIRLLFEKSFAERGIQVLSAENGSRGLELLAEHAPTAIVLDLCMPEMDGLQFVKSLRDRPEIARMPLIVITGKELDDTELARLNEYVDFVFEKECYVTSKIIAAILKSVKQRKQQNEALV